MGEAEYRVLIKEMPEGERPRERLAFYGAAALNDTELIAITLRTGTRKENALVLAQQLLKRFTNLGGLARASVAELCEVPGIGQAKAVQIKAALALGQRLVARGDEYRPQIRSPQDVFNLLQPEMSYELQEQLRVVLLDTKHHVLRPSLVYQGNVNTALVRVGEVFREAVRDNATAIILAHNHPSGDPTPSVEDVRVTEEYVKAGELLDIKVLDHVIIARQAHLSLKERGLGFRRDGA